MLNQFNTFIADEDGAVTVDWVVLTAAVVGLGIAVLASVKGGAEEMGENIATEAACCKYYATEMVGRVADRAVQIFGGAGYMAEYPIERFYRDVRLLRIYEGTSQIQQIVIARNMMRDAAQN